jgi:hypothetical protein
LISIEDDDCTEECFDPNLMIVYVGRNPVTCDKLGVARDSTEFTKILRDHADIYPTGYYIKPTDINYNSSYVTLCIRRMRHQLRVPRDLDPGRGAASTV